MTTRTEGRDEVLLAGERCGFYLACWTMKRWLDTNSDADTQSLWEAGEEYLALRDNEWEVTPESLLQKLNRARGAVEQVLTKLRAGRGTVGLGLSGDWLYAAEEVYRRCKEWQQACQADGKGGDDDQA